MSRLVDALAGLASPWGYVVVFSLALLESAALVGLAVPGETVLLVGGFAASQGHADVRIMAGAAFVGAVIGDSIGFEIGRRMGPALHASRLGRRLGDDRWARAAGYVSRLGGRAVLTGRFVGLLRAVVPMAAGMSDMPYRTFLVWNVAGALVWAPAVVVAGYLAGNSLVRVERWLGRASLIVGLVVAVAVGLAIAARQIVRRREVVASWGRALLGLALVRRARQRFGDQLQFLARRFDPAAAFGLATTVALVGIGAVGWALAELVEAVAGVEGIARMDRPVEAFFANHRTPWLTTLMRGASWLGAVPGAVAALLGVWFAARPARRSAVLTLTVGIVGAIALSQAVKALTHRTRPPVTAAAAAFDGYAFPSGHVTLAVAMWTITAYLLARHRPWRPTVWLGSAAVAVCLSVGLSRAYLGAHWLTDVLGGVLLGAAWAIAVIGVARETELRTAPATGMPQPN